MELDICIANLLAGVIYVERLIVSMLRVCMKERNKGPMLERKIDDGYGFTPIREKVRG
jgi:hypothetical protein